MAFNDSITHSYGMTSLPLSFGEEESERKLTLHFLVVPCKSAFSGILGKTFLEKLDVMASPIYLKVTYYKNPRKSFRLNADLKASRLIREVMLKNFLTTPLVPKECLGESIWPILTGVKMKS